MKIPGCWLVFTMLPLAAQTWDVRLEVPFPKGQSLPQTFLQGTGDLVSGDLGTGNGLLLSYNHRLLRVGPILKLEWGLEASKLVSDGHLDRQGTTSTTTDTTLKQYGLGAGVHAQFWVPFVGLGAELGVIQRYQRYEYEAETARRQETLFRPWLRVGVRYKIPSLHFYVTASYQEPLTRSRPVHLDSTTDLVTYLNAQGSGQEFHRMWTFGAGVWF